jgi:hypothetical protein
MNLIRLSLLCFLVIATGALAAQVSKMPQVRGQVRPVTLPAVAKNLKVDAVYPGSAFLSWDFAGSGHKGFRLERKIGIGPFEEARELSIGATVRKIQVTRLPAKQSVTFRIRAWGEGGDSLFSNEVVALMPAILPMPPEGLVAAVLDDARIELRWNPRPAEGAVLIVERREGNGPFSARRVPMGNQLVRSNVDASFPELTELTYRLRFANEAGESQPSNEVKVLSLRRRSGSPSIPTNLKAIQVSAAQVNVVWGCRSDFLNVGGFRIERRAQGGSFQSLATLTMTRFDRSNYEVAFRCDVLGADTRCENGVTTFTDRNPVVGAIYRVRSFNTRLESDWSREAEITMR